MGCNVMMKQGKRESDQFDTIFYVTVSTSSFFSLETGFGNFPFWFLLLKVGFYFFFQNLNSAQQEEFTRFFGF